MTTALSSPLRDPHQCLMGLAAVWRRLDDELGISVTYADLPERVLVRYDDAAKLVQLRETASLPQQKLALDQIWYFESLGPWAAPAVRRQTTLYLVPPPRAAAD